MYVNIIYNLILQSCTYEAFGVASARLFTFRGIGFPGNPEIAFRSFRSHRGVYQNLSPFVFL